MACVGFPFVLLSEVCVITVRRMLPKQRLGEPCGRNLPLSDSTTRSNQAWISPLFMTPGTHFNLITQLPAFTSPMVVSLYLSLFHFHLLPLSCLLPFSFLDSDIIRSSVCVMTKITLSSFSFSHLISLSLCSGNIPPSDFPVTLPWQGVEARGFTMLKTPWPLPV